MKAKLKYIVVISFVLIMVALSIGLPSGIFAFQDKNIIGKINLEQQNMQSDSHQQPLSIMDKLKFLGSSGLSSLALDQGKYFNKKTILSAALNEIKALKKSGIFPQIDDDINFEDGTAKLYISKDQPSKSLILWNITFYNKNATGTLSLDDETGKILMFVITKLNGVPQYELSKSTAETWGSYLGFDVKESYIKPAKDKLYYEGTYLMTTYSQGSNTILYDIIKYNNGYSFGSWPEKNY